MSFNKHLHPECFLKTHVCLSELMSLGSGRYLASLNRYQVDQFKLSQRGDLIWCSIPIHFTQLMSGYICSPIHPEVFAFPDHSSSSLSSLCGL